MRILSVVSLVTPDGAYGGPLRVAINQAKALIDLGHQVIVIAGTRGFDQVPTQIDSVPVQLFPIHTVLPGTGFAGLASPAMQRWLSTHLAEFDVAHIHLARDLVTLPAARKVLRAGIPLFVQTHGMIDPSTNPLAAPLDAALTRPILRAARRVFYLTRTELNGLRQVAGDLAYCQLANGGPLADYAPTPDGSPEVLYLARLAPRKQPVTFVNAARSVARDYPQTRFGLVGPDEGEGPRVTAEVAAAQDDGVQIAWEGPLPPEQTLDRMRQSTIYVLPSVNEPYPMSVIEALSVGRPVVVTDTCGLSGFVAKHDAGLVTDGSPSGIAEAIKVLLADLPAADARGRRGRQSVRTELTMTAIADQLVDHYSTALDS